MAEAYLLGLYGYIQTLYGFVRKYISGYSQRKSGIGFFEYPFVEPDLFPIFTNK
jgi:hypothetical protein